MSKLKDIKKTKLTIGHRFCFYGPEGVGKSTLAANAPAPVFIDCEGGTANIEVARYPFNANGIPSSYEEIVAALNELLNEQHEFKTVVIDTLDSLEALIWAHCLKVDTKPGSKLNSIEDYGYGRGYVRALDFWRELVHYTERLSLVRHISTIFLGHAQIKPYKNPAGDDYDRFTLRIHDRAAGLIKGQCDVVGFCAFEEGGSRQTERDRAKGWSTGRRLLHLERTAAYDAKTRLPLEPEIEMAIENSWAPFAAAMNSAKTMTTDEVIKRINAELIRLNDTTLDEKVYQAIDQAQGNVVTLSTYLNNLQRRQPKEEAQANV